MDDPFVKMFGQRPPTTTIHKDRDIDYILTWKIAMDRLAAFERNFPCTSDHLGICMDINIQHLLGSTYGNTTAPKSCTLTSQNVSSRNKYLQHLTSE